MNIDLAALLAAIGQSGQPVTAIRVTLANGVALDVAIPAAAAGA